MNQDWLEPLEAEKEQEAIEKIASWIKSKGMEVPAVMALEMHKPVAGISGQAMIALAPFVGPFAGPELVETWSRLLQRRESIERLIRHIEKRPEAGGVS